MYSFDYIRKNHIDIINNLADKKRNKTQEDLFVRALRMEELLYEQEVEREYELEKELEDNNEI